jgi:hypothetical protein
MDIGLAGGANGKVLTYAGGVVIWQTPVQTGETGVLSSTSSTNSSTKLATYGTNFNIYQGNTTPNADNVVLIMSVLVFNDGNNVNDVNENIYYPSISCYNNYFSS